MFEPKIKINRDLYDKVKRHAEAAGYSSVEEFVEHVLGKEIDAGAKKETDEKLIEKQLKGLGYIE